jgi:hypothetical protein
MKTTTTIIIGVLVFLLLVATSSALYFWYKKPPVVSQTEYVKVPKIKVVTKIKEVPVPGPERVITIEKPVIVQRILGLPAWFKDNPDEQAIASAVIAPYRGETNAIATMNVKSGVGHIIAKQEPLSLFGLINEKEVGIRGGYRLDSNGATADGTVYGRWDFLRIGNVNVGVYGEGSTRGEGKAQVVFGYKF